MKIFWYVVIVVAFFAAGAARADDASFLGSLEGSWTGSGLVKVRLKALPVNVNCKFSTRTDSAALLLNGTCRGLILISRTIAADLKHNGAQYSGTYVGPDGDVAGLAGGRRGNVISLTIHWPRIINGDRTASLRLQKIGNDGMTLTTTDNDPASGRDVITSQINLRRT